MADAPASPHPRCNKEAGGKYDLPLAWGWGKPDRKREEGTAVACCGGCPAFAVGEGGASGGRQRLIQLFTWDALSP
ncbi:MAG: hypothetical protein F4040_00755 [Synechococcus sp. SB0670_bin_20]|nr:hypothetical protein [Cyanobacteria bacterium MAG IRC3_bin_20]MYK06266.1 hypothetical protein [Synechococcus sp. SB0670_bin_20]